ncbi:MAG: DUF134 domain-containing protein [Thermoplasmata archaeon]
MPRPRRCRRIGFLPENFSFIPDRETPYVEEVVISIDELEALRLSDYEGITQEEVSIKMGISQPTVHRLLESARRKMADALVNGKAIRIGGGRFRLDTVVSEETSEDGKVRSRNKTAQQENMQDNISDKENDNDYNNTKSSGIHTTSQAQDSTFKREFVCRVCSYRIKAECCRPPPARCPACSSDEIVRIGGYCSADLGIGAGIEEDIIEKFRAMKSSGCPHSGKGRCKRHGFGK